MDIQVQFFTLKQAQSICFVTVFLALKNTRRQFEIKI
jgi:hypothetical protein